MKNSDLIIFGNGFLLQISWWSTERHEMQLLNLQDNNRTAHHDNTRLHAHGIVCLVDKPSRVSNLTNSRNTIEDLPCGEYRPWHNEKTRLKDNQIDGMRYSYREVNMYDFNGKRTEG